MKKKTDDHALAGAMAAGMREQAVYRQQPQDASGDLYVFIAASLSNAMEYRENFNKNIRM